MAAYYFTVHMYHTFIHLSVIGHLSCLCIVAVILSTTMNMRVLILFKLIFSYWWGNQEVELITGSSLLREISKMFYIETKAGNIPIISE